MPGNAAKTPNVKAIAARNANFLMFILFFFLFNFGFSHERKLIEQ